MWPWEAPELQVTRDQMPAVTPARLPPRSQPGLTPELWLSSCLIPRGSVSNSFQLLELPRGLPSLLSAGDVAPTHGGCTAGPSLFREGLRGRGGPALVHPFLGLSCTFKFSLSSSSFPLASKLALVASNFKEDKGCSSIFTCLCYL